MDGPENTNALLVEAVRSIIQMLNEMDARHVEDDDFYIYTVPDTDIQENRVVLLRCDSPLLTMKYTWLILVIDGQPYLRKREEIRKLRKPQSLLIEIEISTALFRIPFNGDSITKVTELKTELKEAKQEINVLKRELKRLRESLTVTSTPEDSTRECARCGNIYELDRFKETSHRKDKSNEKKTYIIYRKECHYCRFKRYKKPRTVSHEQITNSS